MFSRSQNIHRDKKGRHIADYVIYDREIISPLLVVEVGFSQTNELLDEAREWFQKIDTVQAVIIMKIEEQNKYTAPSSNQAMTEEALKAQQRIWPQGGPYLVGGHEYLSRTSCNLQLHLKGEPKSYTMVCGMGPLCILSHFILPGAYPKIGSGTQLSDEVERKKILRRSPLYGVPNDHIPILARGSCTSCICAEIFNFGEVVQRGFTDNGGGEISGMSGKENPGW